MHHLIINDLIYRLTERAFERFVMQWARTGERPQGVDAWQGVTALGTLQLIDTDRWTNTDVDAAVVHCLQRARGTAQAGQVDFTGGERGKYAPHDEAEG